MPARFTNQLKRLTLTGLLLVGGGLPLAAQVGFVPRIAAGYSHSISLSTLGMVVTHGENRSGEIGDGTTTKRLSPVYLPPPAGQTWAQVATGDFRSTALTTAGAMYSWGSNGYGQLGDGTLTTHLTPILIAAPAGTTWAGVAAGFGHTLALAADGSLYTWGGNYDGQLGIGSSATTLARQRIFSASGQPWTQVAAGYNFSLALCADGRLYTWGDNANGQLGDGTTTAHTTPVALPPPTGQAWTQVAAGFWSAAALCSDGSLYTWGNNYGGQLGTGTTTAQQAPTRLAPPPGQRWLQVAVGYEHMLAICSDGSLYAWGDNYYGQLGNGTNSQQLAPTRVAPPAGKQWVQVAAGTYHSLALASDGQVYTTGSNYNGQLGNGTMLNENCFTRTCTALAVASALAAPASATPNPFTEEILLTLSNPAAGSLSLELYTSLGQRVRHETYPAAARTNTIQLGNLAALPAGVYLLRLSTPQGNQSIKMVH